MQEYKNHLNAVKKQILDDKMKKEIERLSEEKYAQEMRELSAKMASVEYNREQERLKHEEEIRMLNRKYALTKVPPEPDKPVRNGEHDQNLGVSSAQIFDGEDLEYPERQRLQSLQNMRWSKQQQAELEEKRRKEREEEERERERVRQMCKLADEMQKQKDAERAKKQADIDNYNRLMSLTKKEREEEYNKWINDQPLLENTTALKFMKQDHEDFHSRPDHYRGMTKEEVEAIKDIQLQQIQDDEDRKRREKEDEENWKRFLEHERAKASEKAYQDELDRLEERDRINVFLLYIEI